MKLRPSLLALKFTPITNFGNAYRQQSLPHRLTGRSAQKSGLSDILTYISKHLSHYCMQKFLSSLSNFAALSSLMHVTKTWSPHGHEHGLYLPSVQERIPPISKYFDKSWLE